MPSETTPLVSKPLAQGTYVHSTKSDVRGPCPLVNSLANHGYIPRDGRNVHAGELVTALKKVGLSHALSAVFADPIFLVAEKSQPSRSRWQTIWYWICNPWALFFSGFGMRRPGQKDAKGIKCLDLDQLDQPGIVEHDISMTRHDHTQGDNHTPQPDLIRDLLESSSDGGKTITLEDLAALRRRRIHTQLKANTGLTYGSSQHNGACTELALILHVLGDGQKIPCDYVRALFQEERLPLEEGWNPRRWWTLGLGELFMAVNKIKKVVGMRITG